MRVIEADLGFREVGGGHDRTTEQIGRLADATTERISTPLASFDWHGVSGIEVLVAPLGAELCGRDRLLQGARRDRRARDWAREIDPEARFAGRVNPEVGSRGRAQQARELPPGRGALVRWIAR